MVARKQLIDEITNAGALRFINPGSVLHNILQRYFWVIYIPASIFIPFCFPFRIVKFKI